MPQYSQHEYLQRVRVSSSQYQFTLPICVQHREYWYHLGSCFLIAPNLAVTAKHLLEFAYLQVLGKKLDLYNPDLQDSKYGYRFDISSDSSLDVFQISEEGGKVRRLSVEGHYSSGFKDQDLMLLRLIPHPLCRFKSEPFKPDVPILSLIPPTVGKSVRSFGWPDHPDHLHSELPADFLSDYFIYTSEGVVEAVNWEVGSSRHASLQTSMRTKSGMSGGPVFTEREEGPLVWGVISHATADYSQIAPIWTMLGATLHPVNGMPKRHGGTLIIDLIRAGAISARGVDHFDVIDVPGEDEMEVVCDPAALVRTGA